VSCQVCALTTPELTSFYPCIQINLRVLTTLTYDVHILLVLTILTYDVHILLVLTILTYDVHILLVLTILTYDVHILRVLTILTYDVHILLLTILTYDVHILLLTSTHLSKDVVNAVTFGLEVLYNGRHHLLKLVCCLRQP